MSASWLEDNHGSMKEILVRSLKILTSRSLVFIGAVFALFALIGITTVYAGVV